MKTPYSYTILRYFHDTTCGEFINVGIALYAPDVGYAGAICRDTYGRITKVFPGADGEAFKAFMRHVEVRFAEAGERLVTELPEIGKRPANVLALARAILPADASSLRWSEMRSGLSEAPSSTLERLYERLVSRYDQKPNKVIRTNEEIWKKYRRNLEARHLLRFLKPKEISSDKDSFEFRHAYKNNTWHCLEPISFDLTTAEGIKGKAHSWMGQMLAVSRSSEPFKVYLLLGEPKNEDLLPAFEKALAMLELIPTDKEIVRESRIDQWSESFERMVHEHEGSLGE